MWFFQQDPKFVRLTLFFQEIVPAVLTAEALSTVVDLHGFIEETTAMITADEFSRFL